VLRGLHAVARVAVPAVAAGVLGCAEPAWDAARLEQHHPELTKLEGHRLADVRPFYWPAGDRLTLLLCRWPDAARIPVVLPRDATPDRRRRLEAALTAWEEAGLGIRFERTAALAAGGIEIELVPDMLAWSANTEADCVVDPKGSGDRLPARMAYASIQLARDDPRLVGTALHELGHALGFQGHPRRGTSIMGKDKNRLLHTGVRVLKGEGFEDATLAALYAVPSGTVLARRTLPPGHTEPIDRLLAVAAREGWRGPFLRAGDTEGLVSWRDGRGREVGVLLHGLSLALNEPSRLVLEPLPAARRALK